MKLTDRRKTKLLLLDSTPLRDFEKEQMTKRVRTRERAGRRGKERTFISFLFLLWIITLLVQAEVGI